MFVVRCLCAFDKPETACRYHGNGKGVKSKDGYWISPDLSKMQSEANFRARKFLREELIIVGDLNLPDVNWFSGNLKVCSDTTDRNFLNQLKFMDLFVQKGLTWHIKDQITRRFPSRINVGSVIDI